MWTCAGALFAGLLLVVTNATNAFAASGAVLALGSIGWAIGPFKTPMVWTEGTLITYEGNVPQADSATQPRRWRPLAVPAFAFIAGILLLAIAVVITTQ